MRAAGSRLASHTKTTTVMSANAVIPLLFFPAGCAGAPWSDVLRVRARHLLDELVRGAQAAAEDPEQRGGHRRIFDEHDCQKRGVDLQRLGVLDRGDSRRAGRAVEQTHLADDIT